MKSRLIYNSIKDCVSLLCLRLTFCMLPSALIISRTMNEFNMEKLQTSIWWWNRFSVLDSLDILDDFNQDIIDSNTVEDL